MKMIALFSNEDEQAFASTIKTLHKMQEWQEHGITPCQTLCDSVRPAQNFSLYFSSVCARYCRSCEMVLSPTDYFALNNTEILSPIFYFAIDSKEVLSCFRFALKSTEAVTRFGDLLSV
jgi:hypothetical protein